MLKSENQKTVLAMGTVAMDIVLACTALPEEDGFSSIHRETLLPGGSSANLLVALASLGVNALQAGKIGDDEYGNIFRRTLVEDGVKDTYLVTKKGGSTLHTYIVVVPNGKHAIFASLGDCVMNLEPEEIPDHILDDVDVFYTDMFSPRASIFLARKARQLNIPVLYNMQCIPSFMENCGTSKKEIEEMLGLATLFSSGRDGYLELTGEKDYRKGMETVFNKYQTPLGVICTAGAEGAVWLDKEDYIFAKAFPIEAIDSTGAGDCLLGGLIFSYFCENQSKAEAIKFASGLAALKCLQTGPRIHAGKEDVINFINTFK